MPRPRRDTIGDRHGSREKKRTVKAGEAKDAARGDARRIRETHPPWSPMNRRFHPATFGTPAHLDPATLPGHAVQGQNMPRL